MDIRVDVGSLRGYMEDYYGTAAFSGFPGAMGDVADIGSMSGYELCQKAERMGVDLRRFAVDDHDDYGYSGGYGYGRKDDDDDYDDDYDDDDDRDDDWVF